MLHVAICDSDRQTCRHWMDLLDEIARNDFPDMRLEMMPCGRAQLSRILEGTREITLVILSARDTSREENQSFVQAAVQVMERNRDNYLILCIQLFAQINEVLSKCVRPAGILVFPIDESYMRSLLKRILNDYLLVSHDTGEQNYMVIQSGKGVQRIAYQDILYIEAQGKLLNICAERYAVSVRKTLDGISQQLPKEFIRCHRSYIVNRAYIERADMPGMTLFLKNKEQLPISRSCKEIIRNTMQEGVAM